ncbi:MAG: hypothetical protein ACYCZM_11960 [Acidimicrobiales bacterium]
MASDGQAQPGAAAPSAPSSKPAPKTIATVKSHGADVIALAIQASVRAAQVRAASIAASKQIAADRGQAQAPSGG